MAELELRQGGPDGVHGEPASDVSLIRRTLDNKRSDRAPATINSKTTIIINELANADH